MARKVHHSDVECAADSRGFCAGGHKTITLVEERDDRNLCDVVCDDCGAEASVVIGSGLGNIGEILAVDGQMEVANE
jgi:hypothetical protein